MAERKIVRIAPPHQLKALARMPKESVTLEVPEGLGKTTERKLTPKERAALAKRLKSERG
jgi:hypothetical protein